MPLAKCPLILAVFAFILNKWRIFSYNFEITNLKKLHITRHYMYALIIWNGVFFFNNNLIYCDCGKIKFPASEFSFG
jgi:hypothetical protein